MLIRTEKITNENGEKIKKEYYGHIDKNGNEVITGSRKMPDVEYGGITSAEYVDTTKALTELEQAILDTALNVEYLVALKELGQ